jgi:hypothetical protein
MNPHYQYAILERFSNADATLRQASIDQSSPPITNRPAGTSSMSTIKEIPLATTRPLIVENDPNVRPTTVRDIVEVAPVMPVRPLVGGIATINLVNPIRLTPVASLEDTIESSTSEPTTKAQEGVTGGGGGVFGGGDSGKGVVGQTQIVKSIFPLIVIAIGISIIIFKPIK